MFDVGKLKEILVDYKKNFKERFYGVNNDGEIYKWQMIKSFHDKWDTKASDFAAMLRNALDKTDNLLGGAHFYPRAQITDFAEKAPEDVRLMFNNLYDEDNDVYERIDAFKSEAEILLKKYGKDGDQNFQTDNSVSVYLWLRYPDKYYIYKYTVVHNTAKILNADYKIVAGKGYEPVRNCFEFYDEICSYLSQDKELTNLLHECLTDDCYKDPGYKTLTVDVGFYIGHDMEHYMDNGEWFPANYNPGFTVDDWKKLLADKDLFWDSSLTIMSRMLDIGGQATCKQLSDKYGETPNYYNGGARGLAERIVKTTGCPVLENNNDNSKYWPVLFVGKDAGKDIAGNYIWKLRDELKEALLESGFPRAEDLKIVKSKGYSKNDFLSEVFMTEEEYNELSGLLLNKKNIILQGPPGVGKTFSAKRLAYSLMRQIDENRIEFIQFHQNYSYEDFIMGYKPKEDGSFELKEGVFYKFCKKAENDPERDYYFIIDEINRGNISKIFGELLMLIEKDYRAPKAYVRLAYNDERFSVPSNLYIIGMMNTADRSLAMIDYALRRRFGFYDMTPGFETEGFQNFIAAVDKKNGDDVFENLISEVKYLNTEIKKSLGEGFCIGHSYFYSDDVDSCSIAWMKSVVKYDIVPLLKEYWFDNDKKVIEWTDNLYGVLNDQG